MVRSFLTTQTCEIRRLLSQTAPNPPCPPTTRLPVSTDDIWALVTQPHVCRPAANARPNSQVYSMKAKKFAKLVYLCKEPRQSVSNKKRGDQFFYTSLLKGQCHEIFYHLLQIWNNIFAKMSDLDFSSMIFSFIFKNIFADTLLQVLSSKIKLLKTSTKIATLNLNL